MSSHKARIEVLEGQVEVLYLALDKQQEISEGLAEKIRRLEENDTSLLQKFKLWLSEKTRMG